LYFSLDNTNFSLSYFWGSLLSYSSNVIFRPVKKAKMFVEILLYWNPFVIVLLCVIHWDVHVGRRTCSVPQDVIQTIVNEKISKNV
jgi:hypothetical protein